MRDLLFLSHRIPYPPEKGEKIRSWHMLRLLARHWRIHLGCFVDDPNDVQHIDYLRGICADIHCVVIDRKTQKLKSLLRARPGRPLSLGYFQDAGLSRWVSGKLADPAIGHAFLYCSAMAPYVMGSNAARLRRVIDMVDVDSEKWADYATRAAFPASLVWRREARTLLAFERAAAQALEHTLFVSAAEAARFVSLAPESAGRVGSLDNGVDLEKFSPAHHLARVFPKGGPEGGPVVIFTGTMDYWPNVDAVCWFAASVLPGLRRRHHGLRFFIAGANPSEAVQRLASIEGVHVTGRVPDMRPYLAHADVVVAPLRIARGVQNKVLEAMAMGRPVVASPQAFEGIRAEAGRDLLVADGAGAMAAAISAVLEGGHPDRAASGRRAVETGYDWEATLAELDAIVAGAADTAPATADGIRR